MCTVDVQTPDRVGRVTTITVADVFGEPSVSKQDGYDNGNGCGTGKGSWALGQVDGPRNDGDRCGLVRCTSGFLTRHTWTIVVTVTVGPRVPVRVNDDGGDS